MENDGKGGEGGAHYLHIDGQRGSLDRQLAAFMDADGRGRTRRRSRHRRTEDHGRAGAGGRLT